MMKDVHTEHCCHKCGCKYGNDEECSVACGRKQQSFICGKTSTCGHYNEDYEEDIGLDQDKFCDFQY